MKIGNAGQTSSVSLAGVLAVQTSCRSRRCGDLKTALRHRRWTCTSICHASISFFENGASPQKSNISSRTSSGSTSIDFTWSTSVSRRCGMLPNKRVEKSYNTWSSFGSLLPSPATIICHKRAFGVTLYQKDGAVLGLEGTNSSRES